MATRRKSAATLKKVGLARAISKLGFCSRSQAAELIRAGRVTLNGAAKRDAETPVHFGKDRIAIDAQPLAQSQFIYWILNKPRGVVTTAADEKNRETVYDFLPKEIPWIAPVGRLDKASEGLLLLTNDSEWAAKITAPETHLDKTYHVQISATASAELLEKMRGGVRSEGEILRARSCTLLRSGEHNCWLEIILDEGKNRHIRRMLQALGVDVLRLLRVQIGSLELRELQKGKSRQLTAQEKIALDGAMASRVADGAAKSSTHVATQRAKKYSAR